MRKPLVICGSWLIGAGVTFGQVGSPGDPSVRLQQLQAVALQRFDVEIRTASAEAQQLALTSPDRALNRLRQVQQQIDADVILPADSRRYLSQRVQDQVNLIAKGASQPAPMAAPAVKADPKAVQRDADRRMAEQARDEASQIKAWLNRISSLQQSGQLLEAERQSLDMARKFPDNPAAQTMNRRATLANRLNDARSLLADQEKRISAALIDVQEASIPPLGEVEFPKDFKERTANRNPNPLTKREQAIMAALESPITLDVKGRPFSEIVQQLSDGMKLPVILDKAALTELEIDSNTVVTLRVTGVSTRTALRKILNDLGLAYVIKNESILITTQTKAKDMLVTRVYYLGDLIRGVGPFGGAPVWGPTLDELQAQENARLIVETIVNSIDPNSWRQNGGAGSISFHAPTGSLIVRQSAEVHAMLGSKFSK